MIRSLGFATDVALRRLGGSSVERHDGYWTITSPLNPTHYWGNFILLDTLPTDPASAVALFHSHFPTSRHIAIGIDHGTLDDDDLSGFVALGLEDFAGGVLATSPDQLATQRETSFVIRPLTSDDDWIQEVEVGVETRPPGFQAPSFRRFLEDKVHAQRTIVQRGDGTWLGAFDGPRLVGRLGIVNCGNGQARYQDVGTVESHRRRGVASSLVSAAGRLADERWGSETLVIVADRDDVAIDLYRQLGFVDVERQAQLQYAPDRDAVD